jgi:protein-disulfide isomerase
MKKTLFIASGILLLLAFIAGALYFKSEQADQAEQMAEQNRAGMLRDHAPQLGPTAAKVRIVEFLDPACGTCRVFYPLVKAMLNANPDKIHLTLRYAPFHENSDQVVALLYAADQQGKHWEVLEALLAAQDDWVKHHVAQPDRVWPHLEGIGLDLEKLRTDMQAPAIRQQIEHDLADTQLLNVSKTPEFFVNGKPMPSFGEEQLRELVDTALASEYR